MKTLTPDGLSKVKEIASRFSLSVDTVQNMLQAVVNGGGTMAQFYIPELGGGGQWMQGGMTMVGDMFNYSLQGTVSNLCSELSNLIFSQNIFLDPASTKGGVFLNSGNWWPMHLGFPASSGAQNNFRYAYFPHPVCRLAIERNGELLLYNTLNHHISGVSQQQGNFSGFSVSSQFGTIDITQLPQIRESEISDEPMVLKPLEQSDAIVGALKNELSPIDVESKPSDPLPVAFSSDEDIFLLIEKLAGLLKKGFITDLEFQTKKTDLLNRL